MGGKATAEFYAAAQLGERIPMNVNPLLLSAAGFFVAAGRRNPKNRALEKNKSTEKISFCHDAWMYFIPARYDHDAAESA